MQTVEFCLPCDNSLESVFSPGYDMNLKWLIKSNERKKTKKTKRKKKKKQPLLFI